MHGENVDLSLAKNAIEKQTAWAMGTLESGNLALWRWLVVFVRALPAFDSFWLWCSHAAVMKTPRRYAVLEKALGLFLYRRRIQVVL